MYPDFQDLFVAMREKAVRKELPSADELEDWVDTMQAVDEHLRNRLFILSKKS